MLTYLVWAIVLVALFHFFVYHEYNWPKYVKLIDKIPGPSGVFFLGSSPKFCRLKSEEILPEFVNDFKTYGSTFKYWFSGLPVVFISDLDDVQVVLGSRLDSHKGIIYRNIRPWLGTGLLTSSGEKWHRMRKILTPTFHFSILHGFVEIFSRNANRLAEVLKHEEDSEEVDLIKYITYCTLDNICETAMGFQLDSMKTGDENSYVQAIFRMGQIIIHRMFDPFIYTDRNFNLTRMGWEFKRVLKTLHRFTNKIIKEKRSELSKKEIEEADGSKKKSFLEMLLESQTAHNLTDVDIREEVDTFMFEGHDTTAASLVWALFELGHNPEVQEKVYEEMATVLGDSDQTPTYQELMELTYTKRVIQEVLRLYPSVPVISRKFDVDIQIRDYVIPANTDIVLVLYHIHRNPKTFPEPDKFDPDRFLPEEVEKRHPFGYVPFSAGLRNCIGQKFALLEDLVILRSIIRRYKIVSLDKRESIKVAPEMILRSAGGLRWKITKR